MSEGPALAEHDLVLLGATSEDFHHEVGAGELGGFLDALFLGELVEILDGHRLQLRDVQRVLGGLFIGVALGEFLKGAGLAFEVVLVGEHGRGDPRGASAVLVASLLTVTRVTAAPAARTALLLFLTTPAAAAASATLILVLLVLTAAATAPGLVVRALSVAQVVRLAIGAGLVVRFAVRGASSRPGPAVGLGFLLGFGLGRRLLGFCLRVGAL